MAYLDNFYFELHGDPASPKLVFLHGVMGSGSNWRKIASRLSSQYHILTYDQRGHGKSFQPASGYRSEDYAEDLKRILDELGWRQVFLVGHSLGGRNALVFAAESPHRVKALVIEDITPSRTSETLSRTEELLKAVPTPFADRKAAKEFFQHEFADLFPRSPGIRGTGQFLYTNIIEKDDGQASWRFYEPGILESIRDGARQDRWPLLSRLSVPTLVVRGERSEYLSRAEYERMLQASPFIQGVEIAGAGHFVHAEQPELFTAAVETFLAQVRNVAQGPL